jgi:hypothetical protein
MTTLSWEKHIEKGGRLVSDISSLSSEYWTASDFSQAIDHALLVLKRAVLKLPSSQNLAPEQIVASRQQLAALLNILAGRLESREQSTPPDVDERVPAEFLARLSSEQSSEPHKKRPAEFRDVAAKLSEGDASDITPRDLAVLEEIAAIADNEASRTFSELVRS